AQLGGKQRLGHISKQGSSLMRFLLVEAGQSAVEKDAELKRAYKRLWVRKGNRAVAKVMVARRLAVRLYWMLRHAKRFGPWLTIYTRMNRWSKNGVLDHVCEQLQREQIVRIPIEAVSLDSTTVKVHPDGTGALKKRTAGHRQIARRMDHQDSYGCRKCANGYDLCPLPRASLRRRRRPQTAGRHRTLASPAAPGHGRGLRGQPNPATGSGLRFHPGGPTTTKPAGALAVRPGHVPQAQRN